MSVIDANVLLIQRLPFDWKNPSGFLLAICFQYAALFYASRYLACFLTLAFGLFMFTFSYVKDMIAQVHSIDKYAKAKLSEQDVLNRLAEIIDMHSDIRVLSGLVCLIA